MISNIALTMGRRRIAQRLPVALSRSCAARDSSTLQSKSPSIQSRSFSSARYAVVDHSEAYENAMNGRHGQQLSLAQRAGVGKDDAPYDPFGEDAFYLIEDEHVDDDGSLIEGAGVDVKDNAPDEGDELEDSDENIEEELEASSDVEDFLEKEYSNDGSLVRKKSEIATFYAGAPAGGMFAVVRLGGSQHKVTEDDVIIMNKLKPVEKYAVGSVHTLTDVLLMSSSHLTLVGMPVVTGAEVDIMVEEITQDEKLIIFKNRRRKNSRTKNGFRRQVTMFRILNIRMPKEYVNHKHNLGSLAEDEASEI